MADEVKDVKEVKAEKEKDKLYKGRVAKVADLAKGFSGVLPVQPVKRTYTAGYAKTTLPPSFIVTRFQPAYNGNMYLHYYRPGADGTKETTYREVPPSFELNVLEGRRGGELMDGWNKELASNLGAIARRIVCTIGTDPEIFAVKKDGTILPAWEYLGSKSTPTPYKSSDGYFTGSCYWDGFQAEFTTAGHITCLAQMTDSLRAGLQRIRSQAADKGGKLTTATVLPVDPGFLQATHKKNPKYIEFGCAPSKNAYGLGGLGAEGKDTPIRFAGGHIHFGLHGQLNARNDPNSRRYPEDGILALVKGLDAVLGVASVSMFDTMDNPVRRQYYGQAGEYRLPPHGLEYRVLSNAWLCHPLATNMVFDLARAVAGVVDNSFLSSVWKGDETETIDIIMNHNVDKAREVLRRNEPVFKQILRLAGGSYHGAALDTAFNAWVGGVNSFLKDPTNIEENWVLDTTKATWTAHNESPGRSWARAYDLLGRGAKV